MSLQIVCFNVPFPPNFGGAIDVFYKIKALHALGVRLHLHCFTYDDYQPADALHDYCESIHYYKRSGNILKHVSNKPFIVNSRKQPALLKNLISIGAPILFEGLHTTGYINERDLDHISKGIRMHNVESAYYKKLANWEPNIVKKTYFLTESSRLANYEESIFYTNVHLFAISNFDFTYYETNHRGIAHLVYPFHPFENVISQPGKGEYIFLHADFSIAENAQWAEELLPVLCGQTNLNVQIAGKKAFDISINKEIDRSKLTVESDVTIERMHELLKAAHIHIVQSFNSEGFKLKLLYSLFTGRHIIANDHIIKGTSLNELVHLANNKEQVLKCINKLEKEPFTETEITRRTEVLDTRFSNKLNAQKIIDFLIGNNQMD